MSLQELSLKAVPHPGEQARKFLPPWHTVRIALEQREFNERTDRFREEHKLDPALVSQPRVVATANLAKGVDCSLFRETLMDIRTLRDLDWTLSMKIYFANFLH